MERSCRSPPFLTVHLKCAVEGTVTEKAEIGHVPLLFELALGGLLEEGTVLEPCAQPEGQA